MVQRFLQLVSAKRVISQRGKGRGASILLFISYVSNIPCPTHPHKGSKDTCDLMLRESRVNQAVQGLLTQATLEKRFLQRFIRLQFHGDSSVALMRRSSEEIGVIYVRIAFTHLQPIATFQSRIQITAVTR